MGKLRFLNVSLSVAISFSVRFELNRKEIIKHLINIL